MASTSWYFNQRDSRWGDQGIGYSNTLMKSYGCAVTAVAMVFNYHGADINPGTLAKQPIFSHDLIVWPKSWKGINLVSSNAHGNIDWNVIDQEIKNKNPVIVFVKIHKEGSGALCGHSRQRQRRQLCRSRSLLGSEHFLELDASVCRCLVRKRDNG